MLPPSLPTKSACVLTAAAPCCCLPGRLPAAATLSCSCCCCRRDTTAALDRTDPICLISCRILWAMPRISEGLTFEVSGSRAFWKTRWRASGMWDIEACRLVEATSAAASNDIWGGRLPGVL